jgi:imidazolonepropionase-like amidohydrolase
MHHRGILMTTGTDITNPWVIPGESLHQEFELLNQAGIPPLEILRMTGANAAKAMGLGDVGIVDVGRRADLVLLNADPRQDIRNTRQIDWVMQGGRLVSRPAGRAKHIPVPAKRH